MLSLHETKILPTENANFSFDTRSTNANTRGGQLHSSQNFPSTFPPDQAKQRKCRLTASGPMPMPRSHFHRTASELNLIIGQKHAVRREKAMFERIVSGMIDSQSNGQMTVCLFRAAAPPLPEITPSKPKSLPVLLLVADCRISKVILISKSKVNQFALYLALLFT